MFRRALLHKQNVRFMRMINLLTEQGYIQNLSTLEQEKY